MWGRLVFPALGEAWDWPMFRLVLSACLGLCRLLAGLVPWCPLCRQ